MHYYDYYYYLPTISQCKNMAHLGSVLFVFHFISSRGEGVGGEGGLFEGGGEGRGEEMRWRGEENME